MRKYILMGVLLGLIPFLIASNFELRSGSFFIDFGTVIKLLSGKSLEIEDNLTVGGRFRVYSRTETQLKSITPESAGEEYYDSTNEAVVVSTGTGVGAFGLIVGPADTAPTGW